jgi:hypothetical protein
MAAAGIGPLEEAAIVGLGAEDDDTHGGSLGQR